MPFNPIKIAIADEHSLFREILKNYLSVQDRFDVVFQASGLPTLRHRLKELPVDVVVLDLFDPGFNGKDTIEIIHHENPSAKILALSLCMDLQLISELLAFGIHGFVSKFDEPETLLLGIRTVAGNRVFRNKWLTEALYWKEQNKDKSYTKAAAGDLDQREKTVLRMIWDEKSNQEIADELFLCLRSIEKIKQQMKQKLGVKSTMGLVKFGIKQKIIQLNY